MSKVISFFQNTTLPVSTMVQLGFLMVLFTGLGLFFVFCGIKAMLRSRKVGTGMTSSFVIFLVGCLAMASGIWVDYICVTSGLEWDQELREYEESMGESGLDGDSSQMFTVGEDGQVVPVDGSDGSSDSGIVIESESQPEEISDETSEESDDTADDAENVDAKEDAKDESDGESKTDSGSDSKKDSKKASNDDSKETAKTDEK